jgi:ZIP family zinc transporter
MLLALIIGATAVSTVLGGLFALRLKDRLHLILGFSGGAVLGVAFFDLLPEALTLGSAAYSLKTIVTVVAAGFALYLLVDRLVQLHGHAGDGHAAHGTFGAGTLSIHSFLDGLGIGLSYQVSPTLGLVVAAAVLAHDFSDGINTVSYVLKSGGSRARAFRWLLMDAAAPVLGVLVTLSFSVSAETLGLLLALFSGFFLYIGASDLVPESHHEHPVRWTTVSTLLGMCFLYLIIQLAG